MFSDELQTGDTVLTSILLLRKSTKGTTVYGSDDIEGVYIPNRHLSGSKPSRIKIILDRRGIVGGETIMYISIAHVQALKLFQQLADPDIFVIFEALIGGAVLLTIRNVNLSIIEVEGPMPMVYVDASLPWGLRPSIRLSPEQSYGFGDDNPFNFCGDSQSDNRIKLTVSDGQTLCSFTPMNRRSVSDELPSD